MFILKNGVVGMEISQCMIGCAQHSRWLANGVRQGGLLSPLLFNLYIKYLNIGGNNSSIGGKFLNHYIVRR